MKKEILTILEATRGHNDASISELPARENVDGICFTGVVRLR